MLHDITMIQTAGRIHDRCVGDAGTRNYCFTNYDKLQICSTLVNWRSDAQTQVKTLKIVLTMAAMGKLLWMEEILHHLGWLKPYKSWDKPLINWCRISSIHSIRYQLGGFQQPAGYSWGPAPLHVSLTDTFLQSSAWKPVTSRKPAKSHSFSPVSWAHRHHWFHSELLWTCCSSCPASDFSCLWWQLLWRS